MNNLSIGNNIINLNSIGSTNNYAMNLIKNNNPNEGTIIWAKEQTQGKGQKGNSWLSEVNKNLTLSLILEPSFLKIDKQFYLAKIISLAITDFLKQYANNIFIKWPNDIYVKNDKIAGILIENLLKGDKMTYSVAGIGININQTIFDNSLPNPVSLKNITKNNYSLEELSIQLYKQIEKRYQNLKNAEIKNINNDYLNSLYLLNKNHLFKDINGTYFEGKIMGVNKIGMLIIETSQKETKEYNFKEIVF